MRTYVVAVLNFFDNEIKMEKIFANDPKEALFKHSSLTGYRLDNQASLEDIYSDLFDCDIVAEVMEI